MMYHYTDYTDIYTIHGEMFGDHFNWANGD